MSAVSQYQYAIPVRTYVMAINSKDKVPGGSINNFDMTLNIPTNFKTTQVWFAEMHLPQTWYVFNALNNTISFIEQSNPGTTLSAVIPIGNYDVINPVTIMSAVASAMTSAGTQTYSCTYNNNTSLLTISAGANFKLLFGTYTNDPALQLGFANTDTGFAATFTGTAPVKLSPSGCMYITIDGLGTDRVLTSTLNPASGNFVLCVDANSGQQWKWTNQGQYPASPSTGVVQNIHITINSSSGVPIPLLTDFTMTFHLSSTEKK